MILLAIGIGSKRSYHMHNSLGKNVHKALSSDMFIDGLLYHKSYQPESSNGTPSFETQSKMAAIIIIMFSLETLLGV